MSKVRVAIGLLLLLVGAFITSKLFYPPLKEELKYQLISANLASKPKLSPTNTDFSILIPKLGATAAIIQDVSTVDSREYQLALTRGVAHATGTKVPGSGKKIFLFAHSSAELLEAAQYNSVFYLLHHLETGDEIRVWYREKEYLYLVNNKQIVSPTTTSYLTDDVESETLILMTCWPPGTTYKRLLITAKRALE